MNCSHRLNRLAYRATLALSAIGLTASPLALSQDTKKPIPLIFDTDIGNDVDDVLAMGVIHALETRKECKLLAVTITKDHPLAAPFVDAVNTFYGRGDIPIGVCRSGKTPDEGKFNGLAEVKDGNNYRYPHDLLSGKDAKDAVAVLREALAGAEDHSVVIAQVGFSTNLVNLLHSKGEAGKSGDLALDGPALIQKKVKLLSLMAGAFEKIKDDKGNMVDHREYNVVEDLAAATALAKEWPTETVWSGFEIGLNVPYPHQSIEEDYGYVAHHPLEEAYRRYSPPPHDRPTWDLTSVLYAIRPKRNYFDISEPGSVDVSPEGITKFQPATAGKHRYLKLSNEQRIRTTEALVELSSQPK